MGVLFLVGGAATLVLAVLLCPSRPEYIHVGEFNGTNPIKGIRVDPAIRSPPDIVVLLPEVLRDAVRALADSTPDIAAWEERLPQVQCPPSGQANTEAQGDTDKYTTRSCEHPSGMWSPHFLETNAPVTKGKFIVIAELFNLRSGQVVLDWGAGCGHQIDLIAELRNFSAVAYDLIPSNVAWGLEHMKHLSVFCEAHGAELPFVADTFDAVLSNGALLHLRKPAQCKVLQEVLRVLRPGGCAWFGINGDYDRIPGVDPNFWNGKDGCFGIESSATVATFIERDGFGTNEYATWTAYKPYSIIFCKTRG